MTGTHTLLAEYVQTGSEAAFRELVTRYVDLVYSAALRLVAGDTHRAEDVAQTVFLDLARAGRTLSNEVMLGGWLHRHTCFVAAHTLRSERRRQSRERQAVEMNALQDECGSSFALAAPMLDEAINELGEADRTAILLRFFEQRDFRAVGQALGSSEDAARMRVHRALEKLQNLLKRRGVTTSAAALALALPVHAVQAAPAGLALTISTAAVSAGASIAGAATATKAITMTTLGKTIIGAALLVAVGTGVYESRQASLLRGQVQTLQQQLAVRPPGASQPQAPAPETALAAGPGQRRPGNEQTVASRNLPGFSPGAELQSATGQGKSRRAHTQWEGKPMANTVDIKVKDLLWSQGMLFLKVECAGNAAQPGETAVVGSKFFQGDPDHGGTLIGTGHLALKPGETSGSAAPWHPKGGQYAVFVVVDPENLVAETDRANNKFAKLIDIPATLGPEGNEVPEGVDLWITSDDITVEENKELGTYSLRVSVHVQGNEEPVQVETRVYEGDPAKGGKLIGHRGGTTPSGIRREEFPWNPYAGEHEVFVVVAPAESELNTTNNQAARVFRFAE